MMKIKKNIVIMYAITFLQGMVFYSAIATLYRQAAGIYSLFLHGDYRRAAFFTIIAYALAARAAFLSQELPCLASVIRRLRFF